MKSIYNFIHKALFPEQPSPEKVAEYQLKSAKKSLDLLECQHLDTILHYEHYKYTKMLLEERILRLQTIDNPSKAR